MVLNSRPLVLLHILVWSLPDTLTLSSGTLSDISCLKSIRDSLEDPLNHVATSWTFNNLTEGSIPRDISEILPAVEVLKLSNNNLSVWRNPIEYGLTGQIPQQLNQLIRLEVFSVANNLLSGPVPDFVNITTIKSESYVNNSGLCGGPLDCSSFTYYFNLCVGSNKRNKIMPTSTTELTATRKNIGKKVDQVTQLPTKGIGKEEFMKLAIAAAVLLVKFANSARKGL
ncbi:inactive LRR receptor-like serine/threonine-protein kinase BIR2 [Quercus robur]|uniref:inactive LRR receptor-like serine/threonine-protein kinase BIR2 n=1 Tax=Quercus robur TaxID=38942 RepID=UPI0021639625|nr:inactive LRR receptor-like serine/threonine-protein kinase BIR2 [Quercus robur]